MTTPHDQPTASRPYPPGQNVPRVWIIQPSIEHYRTPVWRGLARRGAGRYEISVLGPMKDGKPFGGEKADPYMRQWPIQQKRLIGQDISWWPGLNEEVNRGRPEVVIAAANPRNITCWRLPMLCKHLGIAYIGWTKAHSFSGLPPSLLRLAKRRLFTRCTLILAYGQSTRAELRELGYPDDRIFVAQNTIDTSRIINEGDRYRIRGTQLREQLGLAERPVLLCVARMDPEKRHFDLLDAWQQIRASVPDLAMVFVGTGPLFEALQARARIIDADNIFFTGRVPEGDDYAWIATSQINIQPGAVGLAINQSMAFGTPTIIADEKGADAEIVEHEVTGWRYPRGNVAALVATVARVMADHPHRRRVNDSACKLMRERVTIDNMVSAIDAAIERALQTVRPARNSK